MPSYGPSRQHQRHQGSPGRSQTLLAKMALTDYRQQDPSIAEESRGINQDPPCFLIDKALGASAGALVAAALLVEYSPEALKTKFLDIAKNVKSMTFGPFNPRFNVNKMFRDELNMVRFSEIIFAICITRI